MSLNPRREIMVLGMGLRNGIYAYTNAISGACVRLKEKGGDCLYSNQAVSIYNFFIPSALINISFDFRRASNEKIPIDLNCSILLNP